MIQSTVGSVSDIARIKLRAISDDMNKNHIARQNEINGLMLALCAREHILFLGPPGSAKTSMVTDFNSYIEKSRYFYWLMGQFTTPEEIFGPVDIAGMKTGIYRRVVNGKLPEANIGFLDEPFKASTAILNSLLHIMQEREFENDGTTIEVPLSFIVGASNELPAEGENLSAIYDRFVLRFMVRYLTDSSDFSQLLNLPNEIKHSAGNISIEDVVAIQTATSSIVISKTAEESIQLLWQTCNNEKLAISDRRWRKLIKIMKADAFIKNQIELLPDNLVVAKHMLWDTPEQIQKINSLVNACIDPDASKAEEISSAVDSLISEFNSRRKVMSAGEKAGMIDQIRELGTHLNSLKKSPTIDRVNIRLQQAVGLLKKSIIDD